MRCRTIRLDVIAGCGNRTGEVARHNKGRGLRPVLFGLVRQRRDGDDLDRSAVSSITPASMTIASTMMAITPEVSGKPRIGGFKTWVTFVSSAVGDQILQQPAFVRPMLDDRASP